MSQQKRGRGMSRGNLHQREREDQFRSHAVNSSNSHPDFRQPQHFDSSQGPYHSAPAHSPGPAVSFPAYAPGPQPAQNLGFSTISVVVHQQPLLSQIDPRSPNIQSAPLPQTYGHSVPPLRDEGYASNRSDQRPYQERGPPPRNDYAINRPDQRPYQERGPPPRDDYAINRPDQRPYQERGPPPRDDYASNRPDQWPYQERDPPPRNGPDQRPYQDRGPPPRDGYASNRPDQRPYQGKGPPPRDGYASNRPDQKLNQERGPPPRGGLASSQTQRRPYHDSDPPPSYESYQNDRSSMRTEAPPPYSERNNESKGPAENQRYRAHQERPDRGERRDYSSGGRSDTRDSPSGKPPTQDGPAGNQNKTGHQKRPDNWKRSNEGQFHQSGSLDGSSLGRGDRSQSGQNYLPSQTGPVPLLDALNFVRRPGPNSKVFRAMAEGDQRKNDNKKYKNKANTDRPYTGGQPADSHVGSEMMAGVKAKLDYEHKMATLVRQSSLISLPESTASEVSPSTKKSGRNRKSKSQLQPNNNQQFRSMQDLTNLTDSGDNSQTSPSHPASADKQATAEKAKQNPGKNRRPSHPKSNSANQKTFSSRSTKADLEMFTTFPDAKTFVDVVKPTIFSLKNIGKGNEQFSWQLVPDSIVCSEGLTCCTIIFQASSKQLGKVLIKNLCARLKKSLQITLKYKVCGFDEVKEGTHTDQEIQDKGLHSPSSEKSLKKANSPKNSAQSARKRVDEMLKSADLEMVEKETVEGQASKVMSEKEEIDKKPPQPVPTKISVLVDKFFLTQEDLIQLFSRILCDKFISFLLVQGSFSSTTSQTKCDLLVPSKADSQRIMKKFTSFSSDDIHIKCSAQHSDRSTPHLESGSNVKDFQAEIEKTVEEVTKKTQKILEAHLQKIETFEQALKVMKLTLASDDEDEWVEKLAVIDKLDEVTKQRETFCSRRDELIERANKITNRQELSDLLQSVGVECERLKAALPIYARRRDIVTEVSQNQVSIILGETGSGKSTQMTQYIHEAGLAGHGLIVCTQPRKVAAITLAERVAKEMAGKVGNLVGYKTGLKRMTSPETKIVFATDHCLLNECLQDANLSSYSCIIVDEAHERSIYTDLLLGMLKACLPKRPDLKVIITSATIEPEIFIKYFQCKPELRVSGRTFPVELEYSDSSGSDEFEDFEAKAVSKAVDIHLKEGPGDILVFLTSSVDIMRCCAEFEKLMSGKNNFKCLPLHGQLPPDEQRRVFERLDPNIRKIVFATNCAETSITIDGIKYVIDTGLAKERRYDAKRNICMLGTYVISKSSANQRKGRAGRTGSGKCYRLFTEEGYNTMNESTEPEILKAPLAQSVLKLAELGVDVRTYDFVQSPTVEAIDFALSTLSDLGALSFGCITDIGRWIAKLPFSPKEGFLVYHGNRRNLLYDSVVLASLIANESNLFYRGLSESEAQSSARSKSQFGSPYGDVFTWLQVYKAWIQIEPKRQSKWCQENSINYKVMSFTKQCVREVATILKNEFQIDLQHNFAEDESALRSLRKLVFEAHMSSLCCYLGHVRAGYHALVADRQVHVHPSSNLLALNSQPQWVVYSELTKTSRDFIKGITVVEEDWVLESVRERKLHVDIALAKQKRIELVHSEAVGSAVFMKLVGARFSQLRVWEDDLANAGMKAVVVEAEREFGTFNVFSTSDMDKDNAARIEAVKAEAIHFLQSDEYEIDIVKKSGKEPSGVRIVLGQGGCVKSVLLPDQSNKILIKEASRDTTEDLLRAKFGVFGDIKEIVRFKRSSPWGFIRFGSFLEADAAVEKTRNDKENAAVLKIDKQFKKMVSKFEARLSWCRRPIKGNGTAFIKCPPIEKAGLIGKVINLPSGSRELKIARSGEDLMCGNTGSSSEAEIKNAVMDVLENDQELIQYIHVSVAREQALNTTQQDTNRIKNHLSEKFSVYVPKSKFNIVLMSPKGNAVNQVAFIHFESLTDGFRACSILQGQLFVQGQRVEISPTLKTTLHVPAAIMNVCKDRFSQIVTDLEKYKGTQVNIRSMKLGDYAFDIKSEQVQSMVEARELLQTELEGEIIDCKKNELVGKLLRQQGKEVLRKIESGLEILIVVNERRQQVHIYGSETKVSQAKVEINSYLIKLAEGKQADVSLRGEGRPAGLMKELMKKYANLQEDLIQDFALSDVIIDFKLQKLSILGPPENVDRALASLSELESSLSQTGLVRFKKGLPDCVSCLCPVENSSEMYRLEACGHCYCLQCFQLQLSVSEQEKRFPVVCADKDCVTHFVWKDFRFCLQKRWITEDKLAERSVSAYVASNPDKYRFCLTPECSVVYEVTKDEDGVEFNCPSCSISLCTSCHTAYHAGLTCALQSIDERELRSWVMEDPDNRKFCPGCKAGVEKIDGCNKMVCMSCRICFCWLCLKTFSDSQKCYAHLMITHGNIF